MRVNLASVPDIPSDVKTIVFDHRFAECKLDAFNGFKCIDEHNGIGTFIRIRLEDP
jgi:hypothetical protein